jgi:hypothetical protein
MFWSYIQFTNISQAEVLQISQASSNTVFVPDAQLTVAILTSRAGKTKSTILSDLLRPPALGFQPRVVGMVVPQNPVWGS